MKKTLLIAFISLCFSQEGITQNLVPNPSFEDYTFCPNNYYMLPNDWYTCSADPDYFNDCDTSNSFGVPYNGFGFQQADEGRGYCGFFALVLYYGTDTIYKEYLGCMLENSLIRIKRKS